MKMKHPSNMAYTDLESRHIDELLQNIKRKHSTPKINNLYPIYKDMVHDLQRTNHVHATHKKTVAVGALKRMFAAKDEATSMRNEQIIEHHAQTIAHLLHEQIHAHNDTDIDVDTSYTSKRKNNPCHCKSACVIL